MREQYPFFRDDDEQTRAVIGEEAARADLDGDYQKPYAILTQKRLYCKNEQGNFITDTTTIKSAGKGLLPGQNWFSWAVVACVGGVLASLCFWYWWAAGRSDIYYADYQAQNYINDYHTLEAKAEEDKQTLKDYDEAQKKLEEYEQTWSNKGFDEIEKEIRERQAEINSAQQKLDQTAKKRSDVQSKIADCEKQIKDNQSNIESSQKKWQEVISEWSNTYREYLSRFDSSGRAYKWEVADLEEELDRLGNKRDNLSKEISNYRSKNQALQAEIADLQAKLPDYQSNIDEAQAEVAALRERFTKEYDEKSSEIEAMQQNIAEQKNILASIDCDALNAEIQQFEDSKPAHKSAQSVQRNVKLFLPCLLGFAVCVVVLIILTVLKRIKTAVVAALASAGMGLVCLMLLFNFRQYFYFPSFVLLIPLILAVLCMALALWWNRKKTVFQIIHNTGVFAFTPSVYPAEELKQFAEQVGLLQKVEAGVADGE